jgi:hypothetical protein
MENLRKICNVDAVFSSLHNRWGIGVYIRDEFGAYVLWKYEQFAPSYDVKIGEALGLLSALLGARVEFGSCWFWTRFEGCGGYFHSNRSDDTELLEDIISHCRQYFSSFYNITLVWSLLDNKQMRRLID